MQNRQNQAADEEKEKLKNEIELLKKQKTELSTKAEKNNDAEIAAVNEAKEAAIQKQHEAEKKHAEEVKKLKERIAEAEKKAALQAAAKKQVPPDTQKERVKFFCEECLRSFNSALEALEHIEDGETKAKCRQAISTIVKKMEELLK